jgi:hypothetical protein
MRNVGIPGDYGIDRIVHPRGLSGGPAGNSRSIEDLGRRSYVSPAGRLINRPVREEQSSVGLFRLSLA